MALPEVGIPQYPTPEQVENAWKSRVRYGLARRGVTANVEPGSEYAVRAEAIGAQVGIAYANNEAARKDSDPNSAEEEALEELAATYGVTRRPASQALGFVLISTAQITLNTFAVVTIPDGFQLTLGSGAKYQTTGVNTNVTNLDSVEVVAVEAGPDSEASEGDIGNWDSAAIALLNTSVTVAPGGITGGRAEDDDATLRRRLLRRMARRAVGGNAAHAAELAESASSAIQQAFVYEAVRGPGSLDIAIVRELGDRTLSTSVQGLASAAVLADLPGSAKINMTTVVAQPMDVIIDITVPLPTGGGGAGGGFIDDAPWPSTAEVGVNVFAEVTSIANLLTLSQITVNSTTPDAPTVGKRIAFWDPVGETIHRFVITAVSGGSGAYVLTLSSQQNSTLAIITVGMYASADCVQLDTYAESFLAAMRALGPGEKTDNVDILPRARRQPGTDVESPSTLKLAIGSIYSTPETDEQGITTYTRRPEILAIQYAGTFETGTKTTRTQPSLPSTTALPPRILTLKHLSFRRLV